MGGRSAGGLVLLLVGSLGLIGYLTGNLDRWLAALFSPPAGASSPAGASVPAGASSPAMFSPDRRSSVA